MEADVLSVLSLKDACFYFIVNHVVEFSPAALSLLPWHVRHRLLSFLPAADIWRLEACPEYVQDLDMEAVWKERIATHITAWKPARGLGFVEQETVTAREAYLNYVTRLLLSSTCEEFLQRSSSYRVVLGSLELRKSQYDVRKRISFHLHRVKPTENAAADRLVEKERYVQFLFYGIFMVNPPGILDFISCTFDPRKEYHMLHHYTVKSKKYSYHHYMDPVTGIYTGVLTSLWLQDKIAFLMQCSGWMPKKLKIFPPSKQFLESTSNETVLKFLSHVKEIDVPVFTDVGFPELADVLTALLGVKSGLSPTSISIETMYRYQISWLLSRLAEVCGCSSRYLSTVCQMFSGLKRIAISTLESQQPTERYALTTDWAAFLCHEEIETIRLVRLKSCIPASLPSLLPHLVATRPSMRLVELTDCSITRSAIQTLVISFLCTATSHTQSLLIRQWQPMTDHEVELVSNQKKIYTCADNMTTVCLRGPCKSGDHKILCLPFILYGPCPLCWLLELPGLSLKTIEFTVGVWECQNRLNGLLSILNSLSQKEVSPFPDGSVTVTIESPTPSAVEQSSAGVICDLAMCPLVNEVRILKV